VAAEDANHAENVN